MLFFDASILSLSAKITWAQTWIFSGFSFSFACPLRMQACSTEERRRDFEKIFAHYDVVSPQGPSFAVFKWHRFSIRCSDVFLLLGAVGVTQELQLCPSPWARVAQVPGWGGKVGARGEWCSETSWPRTYFDFLHHHGWHCCISLYLPAGDARAVKGMVASSLTVSGSLGPASPPWKIKPLPVLNQGLFRESGPGWKWPPNCLLEISNSAALLTVTQLVQGGDQQASQNGGRRCYSLRGTDGLGKRRAS